MRRPGVSSPHLSPIVKQNFAQFCSFWCGCSCRLEKGLDKGWGWGIEKMSMGIVKTRLKMHTGIIAYVSPQDRVDRAPSSQMSEGETILGACIAGGFGLSQSILYIPLSAVTCMSCSPPSIPVKNRNMFCRAFGCERDLTYCAMLPQVSAEIRETLLLNCHIRLCRTLMRRQGTDWRLIHKLPYETGRQGLLRNCWRRRLLEVPT